MTSYTNEPYFNTTYNNENDALTCNGLPICSTLQNEKYGVGYQNMEGIYYEYGNGIYNGDSKPMNDHYSNMSDVNMTTDYAEPPLEDNLQYDSTQENRIYSYDSQTTGNGQLYGDGYNYGNVYNDSQKAVGDRMMPSKILPQAPIKQSSNMVVDGMYIASGTSGCGSNQQRYQQQGFKTSQQAAAPPTNTRSRMLPHPTKLAGGVVTNDYIRQQKRQQPLQQINGIDGFMNAASSMPKCSGNARILPQPHAPLSKTFDCYSNMLNQYPHLQDTTNLQPAATFQSNLYGNRTINQDQNSRYNNSSSSSCDIYSWAENSMSYNNSSAYDIDNFCALENQQRPHTAMAPYDFYGGDSDIVANNGEYGRFADDNISTYSDIPIGMSSTSSRALSSAAKKKLQEQRKLSLMMAMTTASVIASGETRIPANKKKQHFKSTYSIKNKNAENRDDYYKTTTAKYVDENWKYDLTSAVSKPTTTTTTTATTATGTNLKDFDKTYLNLNKGYIPTTNTTNRATELMSSASTCMPGGIETIIMTNSALSSSSSPIVTTTATSPVARPTRTRKLPKCLPVTAESKQSLDHAVNVVSSNYILPEIPVTTKVNNNTYDETDSVVSHSYTTSTGTTPLKAEISNKSSTNFVVSHQDVFTTESNVPLTSMGKEVNVRVSPSSLVTPPDLSNNNNAGTINPSSNSFDKHISSANISINDHLTHFSTISNPNNMSSVYVSSSQPLPPPITCASTTKTADSLTFSSTFVPTSSNNYYEDYLQRSAYQTESFYKSDIESIKNGNKMAAFESTLSTDKTTSITATTTTSSSSSSFLSNVTMFPAIGSTTTTIGYTNNELYSGKVIDYLNEDVKPAVSTISDIITSLPTTIASSLQPSTSTPSKVTSSATDSLVPLETTENSKFSYDTYLNSLSSLKIDSTVVPPTTNSFESEKQYDFMTSSSVDVLSTKATEGITTSSTSYNLSKSGDFLSESYADYLKKFELPELPPLLTIPDAQTLDPKPPDDHQIATPINDHKSTIPSFTKTIDEFHKEKENDFTLPPYITDFLNKDYSEKYDYLNEYKTEDAKSDNIPTSIEGGIVYAPPTPLSTSSSNIVLAEKTSPPPSCESTISNTTTPPSLFVKATLDKGTNESCGDLSSYLNYPNEDDTSKYAWNVDSVIPATCFASPVGNETTAVLKETSNELLPETSSSSVLNAFDDSFYDSFNVDLDTLTAAITSDEQSSSTTTITTTAAEKSLLNSQTSDGIAQKFLPMSSYYKDSFVEKEENMISSHTTQPTTITTTTTTTTTSNQGGYYRPSSVKTTISSILPSVDVSKATSSVTESATNKATSLIGGLSKGIKGSLLEGVLTGVGGASTSNQQEQATEQQQPEKKGFGFSFSSKFVPNVGGLLSSASGNKTSSKVISTGGPILNSSVAATVLPPLTTDTKTTTTTISELNDSSPRYPNNAAGANISYGSEEYFVEDSYSYKNRNEYCDVDYNNQQYVPENNFGFHNTDITGTTDFDEYGVGIYSEYKDNNLANVYAVESMPPTTMPITESMNVTTSAIGAKSSSGSLLSTITNIAPPLQGQAKQPQKSEPVVESKSGGMFGSFLEKAAAAVQSATQVVNQGAVAIVQQQKATAASTINTTSVTSNNAYNSQNQQQQKNNESLLSHHTCSLVTTAAAGSDYENSNMVAVYNQDISMSGANTNNYYSNGNQSQPPTMTTAKILPPVPAVGKKLPNIINGSKSGIGLLMKQQPTEIYDDDDLEDVYDDTIPSKYICDNGHGGDDDYYENVDHSKEVMPKTSTYLNGYYEQHHNYAELPIDGTSGGYDYREDYFDEEDEYKYLEREAEAEQERLLYRGGQEGKPKNLFNRQEQSLSLEYIEGLDIAPEGDVSHDELFNDDNYPSEDSGNYLDESSSGSVGGMVIKSQRAPNVALSDPTVVVPQTAELPTTAKISSAAIKAPSSVGIHHQIKKQDSILEEDEKIPANHDAEDILELESPLSITDKSIIDNKPRSMFRRKSSDIVIDDNLSADGNSNDQLGDLPHNIPRKKKVLIRGETEELVGGHMHVLKRPKAADVTAKQRWHWAYNKIILQLNMYLRR